MTTWTSSRDLDGSRVRVVSRRLYPGERADAPTTRAVARVSVLWPFDRQMGASISLAEREAAGAVLAGVELPPHARLAAVDLAARVVPAGDLRWLLTAARGAGVPDGPVMARLVAALDETAPS